MIGWLVAGAAAAAYEAIALTRGHETLSCAARRLPRLGRAFACAGVVVAALHFWRPRGVS